jgi:hypothetical protein
VLSGYLDAVLTALAEAGFTCRAVRICAEEHLHARLRIAAADTSPPGGPDMITLCWAEDIGWSLTHSLLRSSPTPWSYLHSRLVPPPEEVVGFVEMVLSDVEGLAMLYPAQFRRHCQPLAPVLEALAEHAAPRPGDAPAPRVRSRVAEASTPDEVASTPARGTAR